MIMLKRGSEYIPCTGMWMFDNIIARIENPTMGHQAFDDGLLAPSGHYFSRRWPEPEEDCWEIITPLKGVEVIR